VVQIWPGQTVTCLHTNRPGHIWTTLYLLLCHSNNGFLNAPHCCVILYVHWRFCYWPNSLSPRIIRLLCLAFQRVFHHAFLWFNNICSNKCITWFLFTINLAYMFRPIRPSSGHQSPVLSALQHNTRHNKQEETLFTFQLLTIQFLIWHILILHMVTYYTTFKVFIYFD
jgi:hypothetical protein